MIDKKVYRKTICRILVGSFYSISISGITKDNDSKITNEFEKDYYTEF